MSKEGYTHIDDMTDEDWTTYVINRAVHFQSTPCHAKIVELALDLAQEEIDECKAWDDDDLIDNYWLEEV